MATTSLDPVECIAQPLGISFHPSRDLVAAAIIDGSVEIHDYSPPDARSQSSTSEDDDEDHDTLLSSTDIHSKSCRSALFSPDGTHLYTAGSDGILSSLDVQSSQIQWKTTKATTGMSCISILPETAPAGRLLIAGDDDGGIKLWDVSRNAANCVAEWKLNQDFITGFDCDAEGRTLLVSSADCTLTVLDVRKPGTKSCSKPLAQSEDMGDELLSLSIMKDQRKVICGTQQGVIMLWSWGQWENTSDRFPGRSISIDAMLKVDEDTVITGSSDGLLRFVNILPNKLLGVLGDHDGFPVEDLKFDRERKVIGSVSHDNLVRFWDASLLEDSEGEGGKDVGAVEKMHPSNVDVKKYGDSDDEWEDMDEDEDMDDSDDDSDSDEEDQRKGKGKKKKKVFKSENERFFADL